jgi:aspartate carbamoyltransferase catalytic subunit
LQPHTPSRYAHTLPHTHAALSCRSNANSCHPPTLPRRQALLDTYTIKRELGRLDDIKVGLVGDLANGRTVRSLAYMLGANYTNVSFVFVAPPVVKMQDDIKEFLDERGCKWTEAEDLLEVRAWG